MTQYTSLHVDLGDRSYQITIGHNILTHTTDYLPFDISDKKIFLVYDHNVEDHAATIKNALSPKTDQIFDHVLHGGEATKSFEQWHSLQSWMLDHKIDRHSIVFAIGGGVIGDLVGFAASTILRGVPYIQVPTTLLAQVDSSVGGKTGINTPQGKNLVGSFYQPKAVLCDLNTLSTLPARELKAGYAEIVKYGLINNAPFFEWLEENGQKVLALDPDALTHAIRTSCQAKADIVAADEHESGQRALLNLGHTFGHALEAAAQYDGRLLHGEAVSIGMIMAYQLSTKLGLCPQETVPRIAAHLSSCGLKTKMTDITPAIKTDSHALYDSMLGDKKAKQGSIGFILARGIGQAFQTFDVSENDVLDILKG